MHQKINAGWVAHPLASGFAKGAGFDSAARHPRSVFFFSRLSPYSAVFSFNLLLFSSKNARKLSAVSSNRTHCS
jgi:hypothetical protein